MKNLISIDVEDYYHSAYIRDYEKNPVKLSKESIKPILDLLDKHNTRATFFILGDVAVKEPEVIEMINENNHDIASHGFTHIPLWNLNKEMFKEELEKTNKAVKKITKRNIQGFRAPYFSIDKKTAWAFDVLEDLKYVYDSSIFPMKTPLYGLPGAPLNPYYPNKNDLVTDGGKIKEYPLSIVNLLGINLPGPGGFYLRTYPLILTNKIIKKLNKNNRKINLYFHPWETNNNIPRIKAPIKNRFITYYNIKNTLKRIEYLLNKYKFHSFEDDLNEQG